MEKDVDVVSVIICSRNRAEHLKQTLDSFKGVALPAHLDVELIVVDNGSEDATASVVHDFDILEVDVRYVYEGTKGLANARNTGLRESRGDIILFTDDDVRFPENWIVGMVAPIQSGQADAVAGGVHIAPHLEPYCHDDSLRYASTASLNAENPDRMTGANMAFGRHVLERVPAFDPNLGAGALGTEEETLFSWQLKEASYRIASAFDVSVEHHFERSRLTRSSYLNYRQKLAQSNAYVCHHWHHWEMSPLALRLRMALKYMQLAWVRLANARMIYIENKACPAEGKVTHYITFLRQLLKLHGEPRKYEKHGLVRLGKAEMYT